MWEDVDLGDLSKAGPPVIGIPISNMFIFCFKSIFIILTIDLGIGLFTETKQTIEYKWRFPCKYAAPLGPHLSIISELCVDILSTSGRILHMFETARDKIRSLQLLCSRDTRLYISALESRQDYSSLIILIKIS